jgi:hypothetical protein
VLIFVIPAVTSGVYCNCALIKVDLPTACIALRVVGIVLVGFLRRCEILHNPPANGKQGLIPEEMSQTLLTNKKQENTDKYTPLTLLGQPKLALTGKKTLFAL